LWSASHCSLTGESVIRDRRRRKTTVRAATTNVTTTAALAAHHTRISTLIIGYSRRSKQAPYLLCELCASMRSGIRVTLVAVFLVATETIERIGEDGLTALIAFLNAL